MLLKGAVMLRRPLSLLFSLLLLAACTSAQSYEAGLDQWIGKSERELLMNWGVPDKQYQMDGNTKMISYVKRNTVVYPGTLSTCMGSYGNPLGFGGCGGTPPTASTYFCETTFIITKGRVTRWGHEGNNCRS
jgi:hypothetical protein